MRLETEGPVEPPVLFPLNSLNDTTTTNSGESVVIDVLENDTAGVGPDNITITNTTNPANGQVQISDRSIVYQPDSDFNGTDQFTYFAIDSFSNTDSAAITITVRAVEPPPLQ